jgi:transposase InsO family protein
MKQAATDAELRDRIEAIQAEFPYYGYRRIHEHLEKYDGLTVNKKRIQRVMKEHGLHALVWRGFKVKTTDSEHDYSYAPNLLPGLTVDEPNQVWVADIERHEALLNLAVMKGHRRRLVAAGRQKLRAA